MRTCTVLLIWFGLLVSASAQTTFTINNIQGPDDEYISDIQYANSRYYVLSVNTETAEPFRTSSTLFTYNDEGLLTHQAQLGGFGYQYFRILSIYHNKVQLIGSIKTDSCSSMLTVSEFNISSGTLTDLSHYSFCDGLFIHSIRIVPGLDGKKFFEVVYSTEEFNENDFLQKTYIMSLDELNNFSLILDLGRTREHLSIDFNEKGYILSNVLVYEHYDSQFNHLYQYIGFGGGFSSDKNSSLQPLLNHYIVEQLVTEDEDHLQSEAIRLIDSNLHTKKLALITPLTGYSRYLSLPVYGGIGIAHYNSIWATANFGFVDNETPAYFSITRVDSDMKIICTHFLGFDGLYKIYGITAFEDNGAIVYGWKKYYDIVHGVGDKNNFALKIGNDCELPMTVSTNGPSNPLLSISVYPNPAINDLKFSVNGFDPTTLQVELIDQLGQVLFTQKDLTNSISVPELPVGQYFYRILQKDKILGVGSWVKQ